MKYLKLSVASCLLLCSLAAFAEDPDTKQSAMASSTSNHQWTDLRTLVREVGAKTHKQFVLDPRAPQSIDLGGLDSKDVSYPQLLAILQINGFVVVAEEGLLEVIPDTNASRVATAIVSPDNIKALDDEWVTCIMPLRATPAAQLVPVLRAFMPATAMITAISDRNALILSDRAANVRRLVELIGIIEKLPKTTAELQQPKAP